MNDEIYEQIEQELVKNRIHEDVDDVLLELAEALQETGDVKKQTVSVCYGKIVIQATGHCEVEEEGEEECDVWIDELRIGKATIAIQDYVM